MIRNEFIKTAATTLEATTKSVTKKKDNSDQVEEIYKKISPNVVSRIPGYIGSSALGAFAGGLAGGTGAGIAIGRDIAKNPPPTPQPKSSIPQFRIWEHGIAIPTSAETSASNYKGPTGVQAIRGGMLLGGAAGVAGKILGDIKKEKQIKERLKNLTPEQLDFISKLPPNKAYELLSK